MGCSIPETLIQVAGIIVIIIFSSLDIILCKKILSDMRADIEEAKTLRAGKHQIYKTKQAMYEREIKDKKMRNFDKQEVTTKALFCLHAPEYYIDGSSKACSQCKNQ